MKYSQEQNSLLLTNEKVNFELDTNGSRKFVSDNDKGLDLILLKVKIKNEFVSKFQNAVNLIKQKINSESTKFDDLILLQSRYNRVNSIYLDGRIDFLTADQEFNKIDLKFISIVNALQVEDLILDTDPKF